MLAHEPNTKAVDTGATAAETTDRIRTLNDAFRVDPRQGRVVMTRGVTALAPGTLMSLLLAIQTFNGFTADDDPYGEHDFGAVECGGERYFWKIDYYDMALEYGSPNPADPAVTRRVMTIMRADEY